MPVVFNQKVGRVVIRETANATYTIAGNTSQSNVITTDGRETTVAGASIQKIIWTSNGYWTVARGANTILNLPGSNNVDFDAMNCPLNEYPAATLVITLNGASAVGSILIVLAKDSQPVP